MEALFKIYGYQVFANAATEAAEVKRHNDEFIILLNPNLGEQGDDFVTYALLHEVGHIECGHFQLKSYNLAEIEIQADAWAIEHGAKKEVCKKMNFTYYNLFKKLGEKAQDETSKKRLFTKALIHAKRFDAVA